MNADFSSLTSAAKKWRTMSGDVGEVRSDYDKHVRGRLSRWHGESAQAFRESSKKVRLEFTALKNRARGVANLLDDAHETLQKAKGQVEKAAGKAREAGMKVDAYGRCKLNLEDIEDPEERQAVLRDPNTRESEASWNRYIDKAVSEAAEQDREIRLALKAAIRPSESDYKRVPTDDVQEYAAKRAAKLAEKLENREHLTDAQLSELYTLIRTNSDDKEFSRELLDSLGPEDTLRLNTQLNDQLDSGSGSHRAQLAGVRQGLADSVATATHVPQFEGPDGKALTVGTPAYNARFRQWVQTEDGKWYQHWREGMRDAGTQRFRTQADPDGKGPGTHTTVSGYQSLVDLMKDGDGYSPQVLMDVADDVRAAEEDHPSVSRIPGVDGDGFGYEGWFVDERDPLDGLLGMMADDPDTAAAYLNPKTDPDPTDSGNPGNERLEDLLKHRDWPGNGGDAHPGFDEALEAGATGRLPDTPADQPGPRHSAANAEVFKEAVHVVGSDRSLAEEGGRMAALRPTLGAIAADYPGDLQHAINAYEKIPSQGAQGMDEAEVKAFLAVLGKDPEAYKAITSSQDALTVERLNEAYSDDSLKKLPETVRQQEVERIAGHHVKEGAEIAGVMSEAKAQAVYEEKVAEMRDFNSSVDEAEKWANRVVAIGSDRVPGGDWAREEISEMISAHAKEDAPISEEEAQAKGKSQFSDSKDAAKKFADMAMRKALKDNGVKVDLVDAEDAASGKQVSSSFSQGSGEERDRSDD
ncbi:DUF6571 family protein [Streptomyces sulphureus]|uniref:DUF6571 family protein n=1 Tax=Streptomyces sulphureus TaxID=47758 RepID=UPI001319CDC1|nr:DUF6571 family protein [Streptomyces sulphureus]